MSYFTRSSASPFIDISLAESLEERLHSVGESGLTDAEREVVAVYRMHWQLFHGGLPVVLANLDRAELDRAIAGLDRIGAPHAAALMRRAVAGASDHELERIELDPGWEIRQLRLEFPEQYVALHPDEFPGPRSLNELWASMQSRGEREKPKRLAELERLAEADARSTDRRCLTCGQPVPTYKKQSRRCHRPYPNDV